MVSFERGEDQNTAAQGPELSQSMVLLEFSAHLIREV
jgi:hypothetical protein